MNFVYIATEPGYYELVGNNFLKRDTIGYVAPDSQYIMISAPSMITVINDEIESVTPVDLNAEWSREYNDWVQAKLKSDSCAHVWEKETNFSTVKQVCSICGVSR